MSLYKPFGTPSTLDRFCNLVRDSWSEPERQLRRTRAIQYQYMLLTAVISGESEGTSVPLPANHFNIERQLGETETFDE